MNIFTFFSPLRRNKEKFAFLWLLIFLILFGLYYLVPSITKGTIYFSVKPIAPISSQASITDPADTTEKVAEALSGWVKSPLLRSQILDDAGIYIHDFKQKISARKQNRMNVFITLKFLGDEGQHFEAIANSTMKIFSRKLKEYNQNSEFPVKITSPEIFSENQMIPFYWFLFGALFLSGIFAIKIIYLREIFQNKISYIEQIKRLAGEAPILQISEKLGSHDERLLEQFILTFDSPRLVGTFEAAESHFSLAPKDSIDEERDTPVLLVKMGETGLIELQNLLSIFGDEIAFIVFER